MQTTTTIQATQQDIYRHQYDGIGDNPSMQYEMDGKFTLAIHFSEHYGLITKVYVFDMYNRIIEPSGDYDTFNRNFRIYSGDYTIRLEISGQVRDNEIKLTKDSHFYVGKGDDNTLKVPSLYSSVPFTGPLKYKSTAAVYAKAAVNISRAANIIEGNRKRGSGVFIFLRYPSPAIFKRRFKSKSYWQRFDLLDEKGDIVFQFPEYCAISKYSGYLGVCVGLRPGTYFLRYTKRGKSRMIPLTVYHRWYTQAFMMMADEPLFGTLRIFISRSSLFRSADKLNFYTDVCLDKLQNNDYTIERQLLEQIAHGKFDAPMLGLLGAYMYLQSGEVHDDRLFDAIVQNLQEKILLHAANSPDILALNIMADMHYGLLGSYDHVSFVRTPMLRTAYDTIRRAAALSKDLIIEESLDDYIAEKQMFDSPYNTFRSIKVTVLRKAYKLEEDDKGDNELYEIALGPTYIPKRIGHFLHSQMSLIEETGNARPLMTTEKAYQKHGWQGAAIFKILSDAPTEDTEKISQLLNLPNATVNRIRHGLNL